MTDIDRAAHTHRRNYELWRYPALFHPQDVYLILSVSDGPFPLQNHPDSTFVRFRHLPPTLVLFSQLTARFLGHHALSAPISHPDRTLACHLSDTFLPLPLSARTTASSHTLPTTLHSSPKPQIPCATLRFSNPHNKPQGAVISKSAPSS